jgi:mono/diheme cytochrome c family protein
VYRSFLALLALFVAAQAIPYGRAHANPPVVAEPAWDSPATRSAFMASCGDCHTHETVWPWYSHVAPVSWLVQSDVDEGREKFNASAWGAQKENEGNEAAETVSEGEMPPPIYLLSHPEARLQAAQRDALARGLAATFGTKSRSERGGDRDD